MRNKVDSVYFLPQRADFMAESHRFLFPKLINVDLHEKLERIFSLFGIVRELCDIFNAYNISPYQCDYMSTLLERLRKYLSHLCRTLTAENAVNYQSLLMLLYNADEHSRRIPQLLDRFRLVCLEHSDEKYELHAEIQGMLEDLDDTSQLLDKEIQAYYFHNTKDLPEQKRLQ